VLCIPHTYAKVYKSVFRAVLLMSSLDAKVLLLRLIAKSALCHVWYESVLYYIWAVSETNSLVSNVGVQTSWNARLNYGRMSCVSKIKAW